MPLNSWVAAGEDSQELKSLFNPLQEVFFRNDFRAFSIQKIEAEGIKNIDNFRE